MQKYAIIVAGGEGTRLGGGLPKQFRPLNGKPLLWWAMKAFHDEDHDTRIILVVNPKHLSDWKKLCLEMNPDDFIDHEICPGGASRTESVKNGLRLIPDSEESLVAIHDAARPLVFPLMIARGWKAAFATGGAVPAIPVTDSLRHLEADGGSKAADRSAFVAVQTPQVFKSRLLKDAYLANPDAVFSDDAAAFEAAGHKVALFDGSPRNIKVTNPGDIEIAALLLSSL